MTETITAELAIPAEVRELLFTQARTANAFKDEPVDDDRLQAVYDLFKWAPSAANSQPLRVLYVRTPEARERLVKHLDDGNKAKTLAAPLVAVVAADLRFHEHLPRVFPIIEGMKDMLEANAGAREGMAKFNTALQAGYFILAVRAAGLDAGPMTGFDPAGVDAEFFADGHWKSLMVVNIGKATPTEYPRLPRLDHEEVARII